MISIVRQLKEKRYAVELGVTSILFLILYFTIDYLNGGYQPLMEDYGIYLVVFNIILNVVMSGMSAVLLTSGSIILKQTKKESKSGYVSYFSVLFGIFTYGCTPCLVGAFAVIGITFSVAVLPFAGLPYKLLSLLMLILAFFWFSHEIKKAKCAIR